MSEGAAQSGWTIAAETIDYESGKISDREQFQQMFDAASKRQFAALLFWSRGHLTREGVLPTLQHLQRLTAYGVGYPSFTEHYSDSCGIFRDAVIAIIATVAKQERIRTGERVRAGLTTAHNKAMRLGRPRVFVSRARIESLHQAGWSWREIASEPGTNTATARRVYAAEAPALQQVFVQLPAPGRPCLAARFYRPLLHSTLRLIRILAGLEPTKPTSIGLG